MQYALNCRQQTNHNYNCPFVWALGASGTDLFAATWGDGVWRRPLAEMVATSVETLTPDLPVYFSLRQNYPNPFNPTTIIRFQIPGASFVSLKVFNILGEEVAVLESEHLSAGSYTRTFDGEGLASGVYCYRLQAGNFSDTTKMILTK